MNNFRERAKLLGISPDDDFRGTISVKSLERLIELLSDDSNAEVIAESLFAEIPEPKDNLGQSISRKVAAHIYGHAKLEGGDLAMAKTAFPLDINVISLPNKTISTEWNLNDETPNGQVLVSLGTLTIKDGGFVTISNRALDFTTDHLVRAGSTSVPGWSDFNVLGAPGAEGIDGDNPGPPGQAGSGSPGNCSSAGIAGSAGGNGTPGDTGTTGGTGKAGSNGKPSLQAVIRITTDITATVPITVKTMSGVGGKGGGGGNGSAGGQGGNGGGGATCGCTGSAGGSGAQGGKGGTGGQGGPGGNGVDAAGNVLVLAPAADLSKFATPQKLPAPPGDGGDPGLRGDGGAGGGAGSGGKHNDGGSGGGVGPVGEPGSSGSPGTVTGQPADVQLQPIN